MGIFAEFMTIITSAIGVYQLIYLLWTQCEIKEFGEAVVSKADTTVAWILMIIIVVVLTIMRWMGYKNY